MRRRTCTLALALPLLALGVAGCGSSAKPPPDPAAIVPASAPLYASAIVRPQGSLKSNTVADARALTHQPDPFAGLLEALNVSTASGSFHRSEVESWLGERAGVFLTRVGVPALSSPAAVLALLKGALNGQLLPGSAASPGGGASNEGAVVLDVRDLGSARAYLSRVGASARNATYAGVGYWVNSAGRAYGLVGQYVVIGSEAALREAIAAAQGAPSLLHNTTYTSLRSSAAAESAIAGAYADVAPLLRAVRVAHGSEVLSLLHALLPSGALLLTLAPQSHEVRLDIDASSGGAPKSPSASESEQAAIAQQAFQALPEDSSLAIRVVDFGALAEHALALVSTPSGASLEKGLLGALHGSAGPLLAPLVPSLERVLAALVARRSAVDRELLSWMGPAAIFVSGSSLAELNAGVVITPKSPALARAAVSKLPSLLAGTGAAVKTVSIPETEASAEVTLAGLPVPLQVAFGKGKFVIGLGLSPVSQALAPTGTLGNSAAYQTAVKALGEGIQPAVMANVPALLSVAKVVGLGTTGALSEAIPYLQSLTTLTAGTKQLGSVSRLRVLAGVG
jgi:hypothetical protein